MAIDHRTAARRERRRRPGGPRSWIDTGLVLACAFLVWLVMDATVLQHNSDVNSPAGARRTAALDILNILAPVSRDTGLDLFVAHGNTALGRTAVGGFVTPTVPTTTSTTLKPGQTTTTTTTIPLVATHAHPLRVLLIGDSIGEDLDGPLYNDLVATGRAKVWTDDMIDTGLTRLDYWNWVAHLEYDVYRDKPDVVIGMMGANDSQSFENPFLSYGTPAWRARYLRNAGQLFSAGKAHGARMVWVSVPIIANTGLSHEYQLVRNLQEQAAGIHRVYFINSDLTLDPHGVYHAYLSQGGQVYQARTSDGIHLTEAGAAILANTVMVDIQHNLDVKLR